MALEIDTAVNASSKHCYPAQTENIKSSTLLLVDLTSPQQERTVTHDCRACCCLLAVCWRSWRQPERKTRDRFGSRQNGAHRELYCAGRRTLHAVPVQQGRAGEERCQACCKVITICIRHGAFPITVPFAAPSARSREDGGCKSLMMTNHPSQLVRHPTRRDLPLLQIE